MTIYEARMYSRVPYGQRKCIPQTHQLKWFHSIR